MIEADKAAIFEIIRESCQGKSPGLSGWTEELLQCLNEDDVCAERFSIVIKDIANGREFTPALWKTLRACRLVPLRKPNGKIRPIAIGEAIVRVAAKYVLAPCMNHVKASMESVNQFGFSPSGCERIIHSTRKEFQDGATVLTIDCSNAFNSIHRAKMLAEIYSDAALQDVFPLMHKLYGTPSTLAAEIDGELIEIISSDGTRQGCVFGSLGYCVGVKKILAEAKTLWPQLHQRSFVDDITVTGRDGAAMIECFFFLQHHLGLLHLKLNMGKTEVFGAQASEIALAIGCTVKDDGIKVVGAWIGSTTQQTAFLFRQLAKHDPLFERLKFTRPDVALPLLRSCALPRWSFLIRTHPPEASLAPTIEFDKKVLQVFSAISFVPTESISGEIATTLHLPLRMGGVGITRFELVADSAYKASNDETAPSQKAATEVINIELAKALSPPLQIHVTACAKRNASAWLLHPTSINRPASYAKALQNRLFWPCVEVPVIVCEGCGTVLQSTSINAHVIGCAGRKGISVNTRHSRMINIIMKYLNAALVPVAKEVWLSPERRIDLLVFWDNGAEFIDVTITSSTTKSHSGNKNLDSELAQQKAKKYKTLADKWEASLTTARWDAMGGWGNESMNLVKRIASISGIDVAEIIAEFSATLQAANGDILTSFTSYHNSNWIQKQIEKNKVLRDQEEHEPVTEKQVDSNTERVAGGKGWII